MEELKLWQLLLLVCNFICFFLIIGLAFFKSTEQLLYIIAILQLIFLIIQFKFQDLAKKKSIKPLYYQ